MASKHLRFPRVYYPLLILLFIVAFGVIGFMSIEDFNFLDALFMTVITISTVGFRELHPLSSAGQTFTIFLIISSFGTFAWAITEVTKYVIGGEFQRALKIYRMDKAIGKLDRHVIVCGYGRNGRQAAKSLSDWKQSCVIIENSPEKLKDSENGEIVVIGDATHEETLKQAGIDHAKALITTLPRDAENLFVVVSAKFLNPKITIISRASEEHSDTKLRQAGASSVVMPDKVGGAHMAWLILKPDVVEFIDVLTGQSNVDMYLDEVPCSDLLKEFQNKTIKELEIRQKFGGNIVGFKTEDGKYLINPSPNTPILPNAKIFVLGTRAQIEHMREITR